MSLLVSLYVYFFNSPAYLYHNSSVRFSSSPSPDTLTSPHPPSKPSPSHQPTPTSLPPVPHTCSPPPILSPPAPSRLRTNPQILHLTTSFPPHNPKPAIPRFRSRSPGPQIKIAPDPRPTPKPFGIGARPPRQFSLPQTPALKVQRVAQMIPSLQFF